MTYMYDNRGSRYPITRETPTRYYVDFGQREDYDADRDAWAPVDPGRIPLDWRQRFADVFVPKSEAGNYWHARSGTTLMLHPPK